MSKALENLIMINLNVISSSVQLQHKQTDINKFKNISFTGLIPDRDRKNLKMCIYDLDDTLIKTKKDPKDPKSKPIIEHYGNVKEAIKESRSRGETLVYASMKSRGKLLDVAGKGKLLPLPDYFIGNDGQKIYENIDGELVEIKEWSDELRKTFSKELVQQEVINLGKEYQFTDKELNRKPNIEAYLKKYPENGTSKIIEYPTFDTDLGLDVMVAPGLIEEVAKKLSDRLEKKGMKATLTVNHYPHGDLAGLDKYFDKQVPIIRDHAIPLRIYKNHPEYEWDGIYVSAGNKGQASEYLREKLGVKTKEVFAADNDVNGKTLADKGYWFLILGNATKAMKQYVKSQPDQSRIIESKKPAADAIIDALA